MNFYDYINNNSFNKSIGISKPIIEGSISDQNNTSDYTNSNSSFVNNLNPQNNNFNNGFNNGVNNGLNGNFGYRPRRGYIKLFNNTYSNNCGGSMSRLINCNHRNNGIFKNSRDRLNYLKQKRLREIQQSSKKSYNKYSILNTQPFIQDNQFEHNNLTSYNNKYHNRNNFNNYVSEQINKSTDLNQYQMGTSLNNTKFNHSLENNNKNFFNNYQKPIQETIKQPIYQSQIPLYPKSQNNIYNIGNIIKNELNTPQEINSSNRFNLISALDKELEKKMECNLVNKTIEEPSYEINENEFINGEKRVILSMNDDDYFISKYSCRKRGHLFTRDSFFYFGYSNVSVNKNKDYYVNIDIEQKFKYTKYPLELMVYGLNKINLLNYFLKIPCDTSIIKFNTKLYDSITLLLYSKKRLYNSVIKLNNLEIFDYIQNNNINVNKLTNEIFDNLDNDDNFSKIYQELNDIFSNKNKKTLEKRVNNNLVDCYRKLQNKSSMDRYMNNSKEYYQECENKLNLNNLKTLKKEPKPHYERRERTLDLKKKKKNFKINLNDDTEKISNDSDNDETISIYSDDNKSIHSQDSGVSNNTNSVTSIGEQTNNLSEQLDIELRNKNILSTIRKKDHKLERGLAGKLKKLNKERSINDLSVLRKKLIHEFDFKRENFKKNGTLTINNNITKNLEIHNLTNYHGYVKYEIELKKNGNYYIDYTLKDNAFQNINILAANSKYVNLIYAESSPELLRINTLDYFRKQIFFHVNDTCNCSNSNKKIITILFYFNIKEKKVASFKNIKIYYIIKPDENKLNKNEDSIIQENVDNIPEADDPLLDITNHQRDVNMNILYEYNFEELDKKKDSFTFKDVNLGTFFNEKNGIIVRPLKDSNVGHIIIKKPILTRHYKLLIELDAFIIGGMNANFIGFDGKKQLFNINVTQTNEDYNKIKFVLDHTTGVLFFGIFFNYLNKEKFNGLVLNYIKIYGVDSTYTINTTDSSTFEYSEEKLNGMIGDLENKIEEKLGKCL